jgi:hypothetical protein
MLSAESQLEQMERLVAKCDELVRKGQEPEIHARIVTAASAAHRVIAMLRVELAKSAAKTPPLANLSDDELNERKLKLVKELSK